MSGNAYALARSGEANYLAAERAYLDARPDPGERVLVTFQGSLTEWRRVALPGATDVARFDEMER